MVRRAPSESKRGSQASQKVCSVSLRLPLKRTRSYQAYEFWVINLFDIIEKNKFNYNDVFCICIILVDEQFVKIRFLRDRDLHEITLVVTL